MQKVEENGLKPSRFKKQDLFSCSTVLIFFSSRDNKSCSDVVLK